MRLPCATLILAGLVLSPAAIAATNETATLLKAHHVGHVLYIRASGANLEYAIDSPSSFLTLQDDETFTGQTQVDIAYPNFNPFVFKIESSEDLRDDATSAAVAGFLQKLLDTAGTVLPNPVPPGAAANLSLFANDLQTQTNAIIQATDDLRRAKPSPSGAPTCTNYEDLQSELVKLRARMNASLVSGDDAREWIGKATNANGVDEVRVTMGKKIKAIDDNETAIADLLKAINEKFGAREADPKEDRCGLIRASTFAALLDISQLASQARAQKVAVRSNLKDLQKALEPFADETRWREGTSYVFLKPTISPAKIDAVTVKISARAIDKDKLTFTDAAPIKKKLDLRQYERLIPEVAAAVIYTDLSYPTWGTGTDPSGKTVIQAGKPAHFPVQGALVLNGVFPAGFASIYPAVQIGVSTAKEFPGFLTGLALRSVGTKQFSLSVGRLITWYRTVATLKPGDVVTGTADIEKDMKLKRAPMAWYGGVQYSF